MVPFTFRAMEELDSARGGPASFEARWPHYREWFLREGEARPSYATSVRMLRAHMPELVPAYERVVELAGGGDLAARMLALQAAALPGGVLAGGLARRGRARARAQLRLRPGRFEVYLVHGMLERQGHRRATACGGCSTA